MKSHSFKNKRYVIDLCGRIGGVTDTEESGPNVMFLVSGGGFRAFADAYHESLHALGVPSRYIHDSDGCCTTDDGARLLWRLIRDNGYCRDAKTRHDKTRRTK